MAIEAMQIDRRSFLIGSALALGSASHAFAGVLSPDDAVDAGRGDFIAACRRADGTYSVVVLRLDGSIVRELPLRDRGHDIALDPTSGQAVVFARRPGSFALAFDVRGRREPVLFTTPPNRHFYGHGVFSPDGRLLYATEHDNETRDGLLGVYGATQGYKRIGELKTFGIGPHEVILLADGKTLAVANGGIETHVEGGGTGREKLNIDSMSPSLAFIDSATGDLSPSTPEPRFAQALDPPHRGGCARRGLVRRAVGGRGGGDARAHRLRRHRQAVAHHRAGDAAGRRSCRLHWARWRSAATDACWRPRRRARVASSTSTPSARRSSARRH